MPDDAIERSVRPLQPEALAAIARRLGRAAEPPWLHAETARRMALRLEVIKLRPKSVLDWWSFNGASHGLLLEAYPHATVTRVEADDAALQRHRSAAASAWWSPRRWAARPSGCLEEGAVGAASAQLLWANMMLQRVADPQPQLQQWRQALEVDGFLMFSTLGPGSLQALSALYRQLGWPPPFAPFVDMHDLGDMLVHAGFADPVMDQEILTLTFADASALLVELRSLGGNADPRRAAGLRTPRWRERLCAALGTLRGSDGRLNLEFELVYGHAFKAAPKPRVAARTEVALEDMRAIMRAGRRGAGGPDGLR